MNKVIFIGNLVANPEFKINEQGLKICSFRLAINNGKNYDATFINIKVFKVLAETCQQYLQKGSRVLIEGRLDSYQNSETKITYYSVVANSVQFIKNIKEQKNQ